MCRLKYERIRGASEVSGYRSAAAKAAEQMYIVYRDNSTSYSVLLSKLAQDDDRLWTPQVEPVRSPNWRCHFLTDQTAPKQ